MVNRTGVLAVGRQYSRPRWIRSLETIGIKGPYVQAASHTTGHTDVRNNSTLYLHSSNLGNFNSEGVSGKKTVLAKLPMTTAFGEILVKTHGGLIHDYIDVSRQKARNH